MKDIKVLDHGFVRLLNISGPTRRADQPFDADDTDPANTARISFDQMNSGRSREQELRLCEYLVKNRHTTPLEMIEIWLEMKLPIFVARQFVRHRTATLNEVSGRYVQLPEEWYIPPLSVICGKAENAKQGRGTEQHSDAQWFQEQLHKDCNHSYKMYQLAIGKGIAPEVARLALHLNHYTHWVWKQDLHNMMHFLSLRDHSHAQWEAQQYAEAITALLCGVVPDLMKLYRKYRRQE
jgi:thymidylate synthase (FAD)